MADGTEALRLAEAAATRLCHDLSGPIGTLNQALELAALELSAQTEAFGLARQAAAELAHRIRLTRAAWTAGGPSLTAGDLRSLASGVRATVDMTGIADDTVFAPPMARALLNLLLLANDSLPVGGRIALSGTGNDVFVGIDGPNARWPTGLALCLADEAAATAAIGDPRSVQTSLTALLAHGLGLRLTMLLGDTSAGPAPLRLSEF